MSSAAQLLSKLKSLENIADAQSLQRFFKTGKGQYGEGDVFLGIRVPVLRALIEKQPVPPPVEIKRLLASKYHEARLCAVLFLMKQYASASSNGNDSECTAIFNFYLENAERINNWDLVDISCRDIVGAHLLHAKDRKILYRLAADKNLWRQRISIVSTWTFIQHGQFEETFRLAEYFQHHPHDLMHKATGWMLREIGKRKRAALTAFIQKHRLDMPRTMLRYAIEHYSPQDRAAFLKKQSEPTL